MSNVLANAVLAWNTASARIMEVYRECQEVATALGCGTIDTWAESSMHTSAALTSRDHSVRVCDL